VGEGIGIGLGQSETIVINFLRKAILTHGSPKHTKYAWNAIQNILSIAPNEKRWQGSILRILSINKACIPRILSMFWTAFRAYLI